MSAMLKQKLIDIANGFTKYGLWKGGGSGGSSALSDMTDVSFTNLQANDVLKYNGSVWVNGNDLHEYSTEEKVVGKWIDGKPIYEKVFEIGAKSSNYTFTIKNLDKIINYTGNCIISSYNRPIPYNQIQYSNFLIINDYKDGNVQLTTSLSYTDCFLVIQYTKTTD